MAHPVGEEEVVGVTVLNLAGSACVVASGRVGGGKPGMDRRRSYPQGKDTVCKPGMRNAINDPLKTSSCYGIRDDFVTPGIEKAVAVLKLIEYEAKLHV